MYETAYVPVAITIKRNAMLRILLVDIVNKIETIITIIVPSSILIVYSTKVKGAGRQLIVNNNNRISMIYPFNLLKFLNQFVVFLPIIMPGTNPTLPARIKTTDMPGVVVTGICILCKITPMLIAARKAVNRPIFQPNNEADMLPTHFGD